MAFSFEPTIQNEVFVPDQLIAGSFPLVTDTLTIAAGVTLVRGTPLGKVTASSDYIASVATAADGSQTPVAVLAEDVDTSATGTNAATPAPAYLAGEFDSNAMTIDASWTVATLKAAFRAVSIFIKTGQSNAIV